jgi:2-polyprenyl-6-methoxyphenol hydroxylase-like FAD-dependent oxidoreductase
MFGNFIMRKEFRAFEQHKLQQSEFEVKNLIGADGQHSAMSQYCRLKVEQFSTVVAEPKVLLLILSPVPKVGMKYFHFTSSQHTYLRPR